MRLILLAHQDDEIFMLPFIDDSTSKTIIYLTSGVSRYASQEEIKIRHKESQNILKKYLSPRNCTVVWWGNKKGAYLANINNANLKETIELDGHY